MYNSLITVYGENILLHVIAELKIYNNILASKHILLCYVLFYIYIYMYIYIYTRIHISMFIQCV